MDNLVDATRAIAATEEWLAKSGPSSLPLFFGNERVIDVASRPRGIRAILERINCNTEGERLALEACALVALFFDNCYDSDSDARFCRYCFLCHLLDGPHVSRRLPRRVRSWYCDVVRTAKHLLTATLLGHLAEGVAQWVDLWCQNLLSAPPNCRRLRSHHCSIGLFLFCSPIALMHYDGAKIREAGLRVLTDGRIESESMSEVRGRLADEGFPASVHFMMLSRILLSLSRAEQWDAMIYLIHVVLGTSMDLLETIEGQLRPHGCQEAVDRIKAEVLGFWILAQVHARVYHRQLRDVSTWIFRYWQRRFTSQSSADFGFCQENVAYGQQSWAIQALVDLFANGALFPPNAHEADFVLFQHLEGLSSRMALLRFLSQEPGDASQSGPRFTDDAFRQLIKEIDEPLLWRALPQRTAVLGVYDVPNGSPVAAIVLKDDANKIHLEVQATSSLEAPRLNLDRVLAASQRKLNDAWTAYGAHMEAGRSEAALTSLAEGVGLAQCEILRAASLRFNKLIDAAMLRILEKAQTSASAIDLQVIPRGLCGHCPVQVLGSIPILTQFRSTSLLPSLRILDKLCDGGTSNQSRQRTTFGFASYFEREEQKQLVDFFKGRLGSDFVFDFESNDATLAEVRDIVRKSDMTVLLGHGQPHGMFFRDGVFPSRRFEQSHSQDRHESKTIIFCTCLAGKWSYEDTAPGGTSNMATTWRISHPFSPIAEAASIHLLLDSEGISISCVAGFAQPVLDLVAMDLIAELLSSALPSDGGEFDLARRWNAITNNHLRTIGGTEALTDPERLRELARTQPLKLLAALTSLNCRLTGRG
jgi:hypothetical protein